MKKILSIAAVFAATYFNSQVQVTTYKTTYWPQKNEYKIEISDKNGELDRVWIETPTLDRLGSEGYLMIDEKKVPDFIEMLKFCKVKYDEWGKTAKENNVTELNKPIELEKRFNTPAAFKYGKWQFDYSNVLSPKFLISEGKHLLILTTGEMQSSSNQFMKNDGIALVFSDSQEIQDFIDKFDVEKFKNFLKSNSQKDNLFK